MKINLQLFGGRGTTSGFRFRFKDVTNVNYRLNSSNRRYYDTKSKRYFEYHKKVEGLPGWRGKDHYHIENPNATSNVDKYIDKNGNPCAKGSKGSHLTEDEFINLMESKK